MLVHETSKAPLEVRLLGPVRLVIGGEVATPAGQTQRAVLAFLALSAGRPVTRSVLTDRLWGIDSPPSADHALEVHVSGLRRLTDPGSRPGKYTVLRSTPEGYLLDLPGEHVDAVALVMLRDQARTAAAANQHLLVAELARRGRQLRAGPPLAGLDDFAHVEGERARLERAYLELAELGAAAEHASGQGGGSAEWLEEVAAEHPTAEAITAWLIRSLALLGHRQLAVAAYHRLRRRLADEVGAGVSESTRALIQGVVAAPPRTPAESSGNPPGLFVGRQADLDALRARLRLHRLVTVVGFPGVGKTRLARELCRDLEDRYPGRVYVADLANQSEARRTIEVLARAIGLHQQAAGPVDELVAGYLARAPSLVVLDNCEHLLPGLATRVERLLAGVPELRVLCTSVTRLDAPGEDVYELQPLSLPATRREADMERSEAVALLQERLTAANPAFNPARHRDDLFQLARVLDGLPLAIELAAARADGEVSADLVMTREAAALKADPGGTAARRSLEAALAAAYAALDADARRLLAAATLFRGPILLPSLLGVAGLRTPREAQVQRVEVLVERALLSRRTPGSVHRLHVLDAVRRYGLQRIGRHPARVAALHKRYHEHFVQLCDDLIAQLEGPGQAAALEQLDDQLEDIRETLRWLYQDGQFETLLRISGGLGRLWWIRGRLTEGRRWIEQALAASRQKNRERVQALLVLAHLEWSQGYFSSGLQRCDAALRISRSLKDSRCMARSHLYRGIALHELGRFDAAMESFHRAIRVAARQGFGEEAQAMDMLARTLGSLGRYAESRALHERALDALRGFGDEFFLGPSLVNGGDAAERDGEPEKARQYYLEAFRLFTRLGSLVGEGYALQGLAAVAVLTGRFEEAARCLGAMDARWERVGFAATSEDMVRLEKVLAPAQAQLGADRFNRLRAEARGGTIDALAADGT
ncbi:MAG: BTAD domain-containing putative transcriptional regulator [Candidatus Dormibacteria bacterium]